MNLKDELIDYACFIQCHVEKAKVLAQFMLDDEDTPPKCYSPAFFINMALEEIGEHAEEIERTSFNLPD